MHKSSPSINIIRDSDDTFNYIVTTNAERTCKAIFDRFDNGIHSFNLIGSFGTGKSSFLWALEKALVSDADYFETKYNGKTKFVKIVGDYKSLKDALNDEFEVKKDFESNQKLFDSIFQKYNALQEPDSLLVIAIDEFGKFLEYAANHYQESEIYFLQKLAEFVNKPDRNILLLTSLHQSLDSYSLSLDKKSIQEWKKVKGRFSDLTFNEPVEQLLILASKAINSNKQVDKSFATLINENSLFDFAEEKIEALENDIFPLSSISGFVLSKALQRYGQNERSLFTFLNSIFFTEFKKSNRNLELPQIYDYLFEEFYNFLIGKLNPDYSNWVAIKSSIERAETYEDLDQSLSHRILKTIGLMTIFSKSGSKLNDKFFREYLDAKKTEVVKNLKLLKGKKIIRYSSFSSSYKLFEGTDLNIELAISEAEYKIGGIDILSKLNSHFSFPTIIAKTTSYRTGTPRLFEYRLTNNIILEKPVGQIDGFVNLIFSEMEIETEKLLDASTNSSILYGYFKNTDKIVETLLEIEKTNEVLKDMIDDNDRVAIRELRSIIRSNEVLLNHYVTDSFFSDKVEWYSRGKKVQFENNRMFNSELSNICFDIYDMTPSIQNELINRHKTSGSVSSARKSLWRNLTANSNLPFLGYDENKWPADKTIYYTLLEKTGIHREEGGAYILGEPQREDFSYLWDVSCDYLNEAKSSKKSVIAFHERLAQAPLKLKQGVIDFWVPLFLYLRRGDFALYGSNGFIPYIDETVLYMLDRNTKEFEIKSFQLDNLRLNLFNKYRGYLRQEDTTSIDTNSFIESIRPLLVFYRDLTEYAKSTSSISSESIKLRDAISKAKDPEKTFFEDFPDSLGYTLNELAKNEKTFETYIIDFQNHIEEIKNSFDSLLERFELFIQNEIIGKKLAFQKYKNRLQSRFSDIKEHQALTRHKIFLMRVNSNLNDRNSFLMSLSQALIGKPLDKIKDADEVVLYDKFRKIVLELDNLTELSNVKINKDESLFKLQITSLEDGTSERVIRLSEKEKKEIAILSETLNKQFSKQKNLKIPTLLAMLKKELDNDKKA